MKASFFSKLFFVLPLILFIDYVLMAILGCTACLFGMEEDYYCGSYCIVGKVILILSAVLFIYLISPDLKNFIRSMKYGKTTEEKKNL